MLINTSIVCVKQSRNGHEVDICEGVCVVFDTHQHRYRRSRLCGSDEAVSTRHETRSGHMALRRLVSDPVELAEARNLCGSGWVSDLDDLRAGRSNSNSLWRR